MRRAKSALGRWTSMCRGRPLALWYRRLKAGAAAAAAVPPTAARTRGFEANGAAGGAAVAAGAPPDDSLVLQGVQVVCTTLQGSTARDTVRAPVHAYQAGRSTKQLWFHQK